MFRFTDKVILVTGGTTGIGRATAAAFAAEGARVVLSARSAEDGPGVVEEIARAGGRARFIRADVAREADVTRLITETLAAFGRLDVAFNGAGAEWPHPRAKVMAADDRRAFDLGVWGVLVSMKHEIPAMLRTGCGAIINAVGVPGGIGPGGARVYADTKNSVDSLTKASALEWAGHNIRVNAIAPDPGTTDAIARFSSRVCSAQHRNACSGWMKAVADVVLHLASDAAKQVTGMSVPIGGQLARER
jgi:NAD(P)-dependent dehydrogenase (short-subunit alcohol dehydrogenase family)